LFDLASMLQVSLVGFMAAGTFLPMPYFDLSWQLMALSAALAAYSRQQMEARESIQRGIPKAIAPVENSPAPYRNS
ncbi:MAG: hypothetical protein ACREP2_10810, partial [Rhodanobacteraceae bacterium]